MMPRYSAMPMHAGLSTTSPFLHASNFSNDYSSGTNDAEGDDQFHEDDYGCGLGSQSEMGVFESNLLDFARGRGSIGSSHSSGGSQSSYPSSPPGHVSAPSAHMNSHYPSDQRQGWRREGTGRDYALPSSYRSSAASSSVGSNYSSPTHRPNGDCSNYIQHSNLNSPEHSSSSGIYSNIMHNPQHSYSSMGQQGKTYPGYPPHPDSTAAHLPSQAFQHPASQFTGQQAPSSSKKSSNTYHITDL